MILSTGGEIDGFRSQTIKKNICVADLPKTQRDSSSDEDVDDYARNEDLIRLVRWCKGLIAKFELIVNRSQQQCQGMESFGFDRRSADGEEPPQMLIIKKPESELSALL